MKTNIKDYRLKQQLTQSELAKLVGVTDRTIISIEKGQYNPSLMLAYKFAKVFNTTVEEICCLEENYQMEVQNHE